MKLGVFLGQAVLVTLLGSSNAYGGKMWAQRLEEIKRRAARPIDSPEDSNELLGDLVSPGPQTSVGKTVAAILVGQADGQSSEGDYAAPGALGSDACGKDACCVFKYAADEMAAKFRGPSGRCNSFARGAVRLGFHDAGTWQKGLTTGGADGSMILTDEISRPVNKGLEETVDLMRTWYNKYKQYGASAADLIQLGATTATVVCPLGPRVRTFVGRKDNAQIPQDGLLPEVTDPADKLIKLFEDKTIRPHGLVALVGAHTTSQQRFFKPERAFDPQDTTPGVWDVLFYPQTLDPRAPKRVLKFPSDVVISQHPRARDEWLEFADPRDGQEHWNDDFAKEYVRLSLLGVNNINNMTECTKVLPPATGRQFQAPDLDQINKWIQGGFSNYGQFLGKLLDQAQQVTNQTLASMGVNPEDAQRQDPPAAGSPFSMPPPVPAKPSIPPPSLPSNFPGGFPTGGFGFPIPGAPPAPPAPIVPPPASSAPIVPPPIAPSAAPAPAPIVPAPAPPAAPGQPQPPAFQFPPPQPSTGPFGGQGRGGNQGRGGGGQGGRGRQ